jgi:Super-infection exclusion protein B
MADEQTGNVAAILSALKDLRISAQVSLSVAATSAILLAATWSRTIVTVEPSIINWRPWLSLGTVGGLVFFLIGLATDCGEMWREQRTADNVERAQSHMRVKMLQQLTINEQNTIRAMLMSASRATFISDSDPVPMLLVNRGILVAVGSPLKAPKGMPVQSPVHIADWAWDYLREHPELVSAQKEKLPPIGEDVARLRNT